MIASSRSNKNKDPEFKQMLNFDDENEDGHDDDLYENYG